MKKYFLLIALALMALQSCRSTYNVPIQPELEQAFIGKSYADVVAVLGAPDRSAPDGKDGQILVYESISPETVVSGNGPNSGGTVQIYINPADICYNVKTNKTRRESRFSRGKTIGLTAGLGGGLTFVGLVAILSALENTKKL